MKKIIILMISLIFLSILIIGNISLINAYESHKQNTDFNLVISSNNATACNFSYIETPTSLNFYNLAMTKSGNDFSRMVDKSNFTELGNYCMGITCTDGLNYQTGSRCREVTPSGRNDNSNIFFYFFIVGIVYFIAFMGFFGRNEIVAIIGGMFMIALGVYLVTNGIIIYRDYITNYFAYITMGLGAFFTLYTTIDMIQNNM